MGLLLVIGGTLQRPSCCFCQPSPTATGFPTMSFSKSNSFDSSWGGKQWSSDFLKTRTTQLAGQFPISKRGNFFAHEGWLVRRSRTHEFRPLIARTEERSLFGRDLCIPNATSDHTFGSDSNLIQPVKSWESIQKSVDAFYRFSRPHTVIGTTISIISVSLIAIKSQSDLSPLFLTGLLQAIVPALFMNIYIVGLNQLFDIEIDKVNKPNLPLASGEYSFETGLQIIISSGILSFGIAWLVGSWPLFWAIFISFLLGTAYSINVPYFRWKQHAFVAATCILAVRAVIVQFAFFMHMQTFVLKRPAVMTRALVFATAFMSFFSVVIALFKDIPDVEGDKIFGIRSFSVRLGQKRIFWICVYLLLLAYGAAVVVGAASSCQWSKLLMVLGHTALASILLYHAYSLDLKSKVAITSFYMLIWKLFYAEYLLIPFVR